MKRIFLLLSFCFLLSLRSEEVFTTSSESVKQKLSASIALEKNPVAGYLSLPKDKSISNSTYLYIKYALEAFRKEKVAFVLLDLDTPGGEVFAALQIVQELRKMDAEYGIPVVALVDNWAISAGALLAYSCRFIGVTDQASMGAAEPVTIADGKMEAASEKMVSALRTEFGKTAELYGRNPLIAEAMVDKDVVLVLREGEVTRLLTDSQIQDKDVIINAKGKLLTLNGVQMKDLGVADFLIPSSSGDPLLGETIIRQEPFFSQPIEWISYSNWKIDFFSFLSHPFISSLLIMGLMIGIYGEMQNPGLGFSAGLALVCLTLVLLSTFATQVVGFLELIIFLLGLLLLVIDLFFLGFGFLGGIGILLALGGLLVMLLPSLDGVAISWGGIDTSPVFSEWIYRLSLFLASLLLAFSLGLILSRFVFHKSPFRRKLVLKDPIKEAESFDNLPKKGSRGVAFSSFRPFGKVEIGGKIYDAKTEGEFVIQGSSIEVVGSLGRCLLIREIL